MPRRKIRPSKKNTKRKSAPRNTNQALSPLKRGRALGSYTEEYAEYLERYEILGEGRPRLSPAEYDRFDNEFLDLLTIQGEMGVLSDDQMIRLQELEFLLLDEQ